jgi:hypothetical protein
VKYGVDSKPSEAKDPSVVVIKQQQGRDERRKVYRIMYMGTQVNYGVHNNTVANFKRGVLERVRYVKNNDGNFVRPPTPGKGVFAARLTKFKRRLLRVLPSTTAMTREQFPTLYRGRKRTIYEAAVESLRQKPVQRRDSSSKSFLKAEKIKFTKAKPDPPPRLIHPRHPRYNVEVGKFLRPLEHKIYTGIKRIWEDVTVSKGLNSAQVGKLIKSKWDKFRKPCAIGLDASRFDQHVSKQALVWEHSVYNSVYRDPELLKLLSWQLGTRCYGRARDGTVKYEIEGMRMSGDMNTALGNCLIMCALVWAYCEEIGVKSKLINNGDDCVVFLEQRDAVTFRASLGQWFMDMGFSMKVEDTVYDVEKVEFCQCRPVWTEDQGYIMVRNVKDCLSKDCTCIIDISTAGGFLKWAYSIGECGLSLAGGIPVLDQFYRALMRSGRKGGKVTSHPYWESGMTYLAKGMDRKLSRITARTRHSFYLAFGVTPDEQIMAENYFSLMTVRHADPIFLETWRHQFQIDIKECLLYPHTA